MTSPERRHNAFNSVTIAQPSPIVCRVCFPLVQQLCGKNGATLASDIEWGQQMAIKSKKASIWGVLRLCLHHYWND
jgi:hypothetical protein